MRVVDTEREGEGEMGVLNIHVVPKKLFISFKTGFLTVPGVH